MDLTRGEGTCDFPCSGDESSICGGFYSFTLYELTEAPPPTPAAEDGYVGCFADDKDDRVLGAKMSSSEMTSEVCRCASSRTFQISVVYRTIAHGEDARLPLESAFNNHYSEGGKR